METWRPMTTNPPTLLRISWFWVFFRWIFNVNGYVGNKRSTIIVDQNYYHEKGLIVSYKKHFYHFLIRHILNSLGFHGGGGRTSSSTLSVHYFPSNNGAVIFRKRCFFRRRPSQSFFSVMWKLNFFRTDKLLQPFYHKL